MKLPVNYKPSKRMAVYKKSEFVFKKQKFNNINML